MLLQQIIVLEFPRGNLPLEQDIQLLERSPPALWNPKPAPNTTHQTYRPKQKPSLSTPVCFIGI